MFYIHKNMVAYGVYFLDISNEEEKLLRSSLNQIMLEKRKEIS